MQSCLVLLSQNEGDNDFSFHLVRLYYGFVKLVSTDILKIRGILRQFFNSS